jgi:NAD(P)-dependent dehydrogenase (short-subunit alcohol dehydrogenase family)
MSANDMSAKVVYISGGTSGINLGVAKGFASAGARVLVFGRNPDKAAAAADEIARETGQRAMAGAADVRDPTSVAALFALARAQIGPPNVVIAGAAGNFMASAVNLSPKGFKTVVDIDLLGTYNVFCTVFEMLQKPGASLIAITAPQAVHPMPQQVHVCAAKAGVNMIVKVLAMEWGPAGVRVNAICPGPIAGTEGVQRMAPTPASQEMWLQRTALRRFGTPTDIARAALYLSSEDAAYITGTILDCDGGMGLGDASGTYLEKHGPRSGT